MSAIEEAIAKARAAAAGINSASSQSQAGEAQVDQAPPPASTAVVQAPGFAMPSVPAVTGAMSLEDSLSDSLQVDAWLKLTEYGIHVGDDNFPHQSLKVGIIAEGILPHRAVRITIGKKTLFFRSANGQTEDRTGEPWLNVVRNCMAQDPTRCKGDYQSWSIPFIAVEDIKNPTGNVVCPAGSTLGHSVPATGGKFFQPFLKKVLLANPRDAVIVGTIFHKKLSNEGNNWGVLDFGDLTAWKIKTQS